MTEADLEEACAWDRPVFGAGRRDLLASFFARAPECAWVIRDGGRLAAYCFGRPGYLYPQLGPLVAADCGAAQELVRSCLCQFDAKRVAIDVPASQTEWTGWLRSAGFQQERPFARMYLGGSVQIGTPGQQFAIAGPEFG
jgi:hypothetical protein